MKISLLRSFQFEAAHENRSATGSERTRRLHGHSYGVTAYITGVVDAHLGWLVDFAEVKDNCKPVIDQLDHRVLNDIAGITDATLPDVQQWLTSRLAAAQTGFDRCVVRVIGDTQLQPSTVMEGPRARVEFGFAAAHLLPNLPDGHKCRRMHGHSYHVTVTARDPQSILTALPSLYPLVDHRELNKIPGLENPTAEYLSRWLWNEFRARDVETEVVQVNETCTSGCLFRGEED